MPNRISILRASIFVSSLSFSFAAAAQTQPDPGMPRVAPNSPSGIFAGKGQLAIMSETGVTFTNSSVSGVDGSSTVVQIRPAVDYFLIDHLSLGAFVGVDYASTQAGSSTTFGLGPRVGYDIPFSERFSVWPKAGLSFNSTSVTIDAVDGLPESSTSNTALGLNLFVPIMFHTNHYFVGFGPSLDTDLTGDAKRTTVAIRLSVGGWLF
jgi:hypothetical protein